MFAVLLQVEQNKQCEGEVCNPPARCWIGESNLTRPVSHCKHERPYTPIWFSQDVQQFTHIDSRPNITEVHTLYTLKICALVDMLAIRRAPGNTLAWRITKAQLKVTPIYFFFFTKHALICVLILTMHLHLPMSENIWCLNAKYLSMWQWYFICKVLCWECTLYMCASASIVQIVTLSIQINSTTQHSYYSTC
jgi:hypothetical protein